MAQRDNRWLAETRAEVHARLARCAEVRTAPHPTPRYDEIFVAGVHWLDSLAGKGVPTGEIDLAIEPDDDIRGS